jgi:hypothetical protein
LVQNRNHFFSNNSYHQDLQKLLKQRSPGKLSSGTYLHHTTSNVYKSIYSETYMPSISTNWFRTGAIFFTNNSNHRELQKLLKQRSPGKLSSGTYLHHTTPNMHKSTRSETCIPSISTIWFRTGAIFSATLVVIESYKRAMTETCKNAVFWSVERAISRCRG